MLFYGMGMDIQSGLASNNFDEVRGRTLSSNRNISRDVSMSSTKLSVIYHERMTTNNVNNNDDPVDASSKLSYETEQKKAFCVSKVADQQLWDVLRAMHGSIGCLGCVLCYVCMFCICYMCV